MKKMIAVVALTVFVIAAQAQSDKFTGAMQHNLALLDSAKTTEDLQSVSAAFERVGDAEKTQWLPYYYAGLALTSIGWMDKKIDKDELAGRVKALAAKGEAIEGNAEFCTLRNMAATQQMMVDPMSRWQTYGAEAHAALEKGMQLDPKNPRIYYLQGMSLFGTPSAYGGGKDKAKPVFQKSVDLFKTAEVKPLYPKWGQKQAEDMLAKCN